MEPAAFDRCVDDHSDTLFRFALKHLRDRELAKDIVQESYLRLWQRLDRVEGDKARSYLFTIAHHLIVDHASRSKRTQRLEQGHEDLHISHQPCACLNEVIDRSLEALTPLQRDLVLMRDREDQSYREIAAKLGLDLARVKVYLHRARQAMRHQLGPLDMLV